MLHLFEPAANSRDGDRIRRSPAVPVVGAVAVGITIDHFALLRFEFWWVGTLAALLSAILCWKREWRRGISIALLAACAGLGGSWHHWRWACVPDNDISAFTQERTRPIQLVAKVLQVPVVLQVDQADQVPWQAPERTISVIACESLVDGHGQFIQVSGQVRLAVTGRVDHLQIGDRIEITGTLTRPAEPSNPGEFNRRIWLRSQGLQATVSADFPDAIRTIGSDRHFGDRLLAWRAAVRKRAEDLMTTNLSSRTAPVAQSLLLGSRVDLDRDLRRAFAESGTLHVLAISGTNVGLLWILLLRFFRALRWSPLVSLVTVLVVLPAYTFITDANPPVVRATIVAVVLAIGQLSGRKDSKWNSLAIAALLVLVWNPTDLFNSGAQLSFVAVVAILLAASFLGSVNLAIDPQEGPPSGSMIRRGASSIVKSLFKNCMISAAIWAMTSPLISSQFHLVSPIGVVLNVLLGPLIALMFWLGYLFLLLGMILPAAFGWLGGPFDFTLGLFLWAVEQAAKLPMGHNYVPAPQAWWTIGFYLLTLSLVVIDHRRGRVFWPVQAILAWSVLGLCAALNSSRAAQLSCTFLSVGHGLSVVVECPNGRTLLYDAGSMKGGTSTARIIEASLWEAGKVRFDAIVVSHADADHCNALPELFDVVPVGAFLTHRTFLDWTQPPVAAAIDGSWTAGIPIRLLATGQSLQLDPEVSITVLHPAPEFHGSEDNSNSVVLCIEFRGKRILLTGDLERDGLLQLLQSEPIDVDILLSPHHGSMAANSADLARWSNPEWLIVSCRDDAVVHKLAANYAESTQILTTARHGAIKCTIQSNGDISVIPFRSSTP